MSDRRGSGPPEPQIVISGETYKRLSHRADELCITIAELVTRMVDAALEEWSGITAAEELAAARTPRPSVIVRRGHK